MNVIDPFDPDRPPMVTRHRHTHPHPLPPASFGFDHIDREAHHAVNPDEARKTHTKAVTMVAIAVFALVVLGTIVTNLIGGSDAASDTPSPTSSEQLFVQHLDGEGVWHPDGDAGTVRIGYQVCNMAAEGYTYPYVVNELFYAPGSDLTYGQAAVVVSYAIEDLCPQYS